MRNFLTSFFNAPSPHGAERASGRPEMLRRQTLETNSRLTVIASGLGMPAALFLLTQGMLMPFVLVILGLAIGVIGLTQHRNGQYESAAATQIYGILAIGLVLTVADPTLADFGLATALLAPVHAALLARTPMNRRTWVLLVGVVAIATASSLGLPLWPEPHHAEFVFIAAISFTVTAVIVAHSGNRLNSVFEVYEKAQINAYRHLIENVQDAVLRFSAEGGMLFISRSSEKLFGCRRYELSGNGLVERMHVTDRPIFLTAFAEANRDGKARTVEVRMRRDDPETPGARSHFMWVEIALSPVVDPESSASGHEVVALLRDVTERRDSVNEMEKARQEAEQASVAKSRFLAVIGHELRTPLNAIVGFSEMMSSGIAGDLAPAHREYAELIRQSGHHLIEVVGMLLDMSRIEAGKFELDSQAFQPETLIAPCMQMVEQQARGRNVTVETEIAKALPMLTADERACRQILINLLSNAVKFSNDGGRVTLAMKRQGRFLNISVRDQGIGMPVEAVNRIGEPFFQANDGLARRYEGTGLGLSIVKGLIDLHDGELHAISAPGEGTTMTVLLPLNGPATKLQETQEVRTLRPAPVQADPPTWHEEEKRKAL
jgi:cell cycle sensor histidine kinase DivJ